MEEDPKTEHSNALHTQAEYLKKRILELEIENAKLSVQISRCTCQKIVVSDKTNAFDSTHTMKEKMGQKTDAKNRSEEDVADIRREAIVLHHSPRRHIALKVMYFGQRFYGFASEAHMDPTIESEIFKALEKTRLISGDKKSLQYSRCGRTDKGVSSFGQVISLLVRSNMKETTESIIYSGESSAGESYGNKIDYVKVLNKVLPKDIRVIGWSPAPTDFSSRFSCLSREYKYFFWRENLNIMVMEIAGKKFTGEHDFRNFCKMDAANVHNYRRHITSFEIIPCNERFEDDELWALKIKGSAFLWHQIRCMAAVLFLIGQGLESPNVIDELLDIERTPRKPQYTMAPEIPLVLQSCQFQDLEFKCSSDAAKTLRDHLEKECRSYKLQAAIFHEALLSSSCALYEINQLSSKTNKKESAHVLLLSRPTEPTYEERCAKLNARVGKRTSTKTPILATK